MKKLNIENRKFGSLTALEPTNKRKHGRVIWKCVCDCGNIVYVDADSLVTNRITGCGCHRTLETRIIGTKFGRLTAIEKIERKSNDGAYYYMFQCDCGTKKEILGTSVFQGKTTSCGCFHRDKIALPKGEANFRELFRSYQRSAKSRCYEFSIDLDTFLKLVTSNCYYCNKEPKQIMRAKGNYGEFIYNGIDRVDNSKGYIDGNVVPCCKDCNVKDKKGVTVHTMIKALEFLGYKILIPDSMK